MRFQIILFDGFDELDSIAPYEVLHCAAKHQAGWVVEYAALEGPREIRAHHGTRLFAQAKLGPFTGKQRPDVVIVRRAAGLTANPQGARAEVAKGRLPAALAKLHEAGTLTCSVCTGAMILAAAGLLKGRPAITHHRRDCGLARQRAKVVRQRVVDAGDIVHRRGRHLRPRPGLAPRHAFSRSQT